MGNEYNEFFMKDDCLHDNRLSINKEESKSIDVMEYFVFDENEDNIIEENCNLFKNLKIINGDKDKKTKVSYNVCTFLSTKTRPDLYSPLGVIKGNNYQIILEKEKNKEEIKNEDEDIISLSSFDSVDEEIIIENKKKKIKRYFDIENDISLKCIICDQVGHTHQNCLYSDIKFCHRCIQYGHDMKQCDKKKCFTCNKLGHTIYNCKLGDEKLIICEQCNCVGHTKEECLLNPLQFNKSDLKHNNLSCFICGSEEHALCQLSIRELPMIRTEENIIIGNNIVYSLSDLDEEESFQNIIFCSFCGDNHTNDNCSFKDNFNNKYDKIRKNTGIKIMENRNKKKESNLQLIHDKEENNCDNNKIISLDEGDSCDGEANYLFVNKGQKKNKRRKKGKRRNKSKDNENMEKNNKNPNFISL